MQKYTTFNNISAGNYFANISFLGYKPETISPIYIPADSPPESGFKVILKPQSVKLSPVTVSAKKDKIVFEDDKIVYNVMQDARILGGSAMEVLENAPMVKIDIDDNVKLLGRKSVAVCIDDVPITSLGMSTKDYLKSIHWTEIERIEIMHNPPSGYDIPEGSGAINIILKKKIDKKYSGFVDAAGTTKDEYNSGVGLNYKLGELNIKSSYSGSYFDFKSFTDVFRQSSLNDIPVLLNSENDSRYKSLKNSFRLVLIYNPDNKISIFQTTNYNYLYNKNSIDIVNLYTDEAQNTPGMVKNNKISVTGTSFFSYALNYMQSCSSNKQKLKAIFIASNNLMDQKNDLSYADSLSIYELYRINNNYSLNKNNSFSLNLTYTHPFCEEVLLKTGYSGKLKLLWLKNNYYDVAGNNYIENKNDKLYQDYTDLNNEFSTGLSGKFKGISYSFSLDFKDQKVNSDYTLSKEKFNYSFFHINPGIDLRYNPGKTGQMVFNWGQSRLNPLNKELNPHIDYSDSSNIIMGNPFLTPEKYEKFEITYNDFTSDQSFSFGIQYSRSWNVIESYTYMENDRTAITTYKNIGRMWRFYFSGDYSRELTDWFSVNLSLDIDNEKYSKNEYNNNNIPYDITFSPELRLKNFLLQADIKYSSSYGSFQYSSPESYYVNLGIKTSIFEKRLFLYFKAKDIFNTLNRNSTRYGTGYISSVRTNETSRILSLGLSYYFQETESAEQRVEEELKDDF